MKRNLSILFTFVFTTFAFSQQLLNVPDQNFKNYLLTIPELKQGTVNISMTKAMAYTGSLNCPGLNISDLTGIEAFLNLTSLNCSNNLLTTLDVSNNVALTYLSCGGNDLATLDVSNNTALAYLYCENNLLTNLNLGSISNLKTLHCNDNFLTTLNVSNKTALSDLRCGFNELTNLDVSQNTDLNYLHCQNNALTSLDVSNNTVLVYLYCGYNNLTALDVSQNTLSRLYCENNALTSLDLSSKPNMTHLYCQNNDLYYLDISGLGAEKIRNQNTSSSCPWYESCHYTTFNFNCKGNPNLSCLKAHYKNHGSTYYWYYNYDTYIAQCYDTATTCHNIACYEPSFNQVPTAICQGSDEIVLPISHTYVGINFPGTWSPAPNNQETTTYTFLPTVINCNTYVYGFKFVTKTIEVIPNEPAPTFSFSTSLCYGNGLFTLPSTSDNDIPGIWSPSSTVDTGILGTQTFTFTRTDNVCAEDYTITKEFFIQTNTMIAPAGPPTQTFTAGQTLADLQVTHTNTLEWYANASLTVLLPATTPLVNYATYYAVSTNGVCQSDFLAITVTLTVNVSDFDVFGFSYYPNPTSDMLHFSSNTTIENVLVTNMLGQQINVSVSSDNKSLDMSDLPTGNYLVKITIEGVAKMIKVVKK